MNRAQLDAFGIVSLTLFSALLAFNQIVIKVVNQGFGPVFSVGLRSLIALGAVLLWMWWRKLPLELSRRYVVPGLAAGLVFSAEFMCLFTALDWTTVSRTSIIFYSMPVWLAVAGHFWLPGERLTPIRWVGLVLAMTGVVVALADRSGGGSVAGDLMALGGAFGWAAIALLNRLSPLRELRAEMQLLWQLAVSGVLLTLCAPLFGPLLRAPEPIHIAGLIFLSIVVVAFGFTFWFWLLTRYQARAVASFSFLAPIMAVLMAWWLLDEALRPGVWVALGLVVIGLLLINRPQRGPG